MQINLYLSLIPEALIASMLAPEEFGSYYATGTAHKTRGQAMFLELDPGFRDAYFPVEEGLRRCAAHDAGSPNATTYISVYRVLEHVRLDAIRKLHLVTRDGRTLALEASAALPQETDVLHLYQEIAPVHPLVVSTLGPRAFYELIVRDPASLLRLPAICFAEMQLGELAADPEHGRVRDLPYANIDHLRQCLLELRTKAVHTKMVDRVHPPEFAYRVLENGIYAGNTSGLLYFPLPAVGELRERHYAWWRSAAMPQ
ncbi:MAG: hypothetical protein KBG29_11400 [Pseudomonadales bacterium]|jgi:hypothetical protein|nr:hypothetical protein [Pseudomonadales bacterium]